MSTYFVDTSALAKRYIAETGSSWVLSWVEPPANNVIVVSELAIVEMHSLFARRQREGKLSLTSIYSLRVDFLLHFENEYLSVPIEGSILKHAQHLITNYTLRTLDAIQLACALHAENILSVSMNFVSADNNLLTAATAEGFMTDNPLNHP